MENRRNYYRILHVQPDAPLPLIKSSYRTLMQTLKMHPDLGGDHWNATLINEAYETLSDVEKRAEYDERLISKLIPKHIQIDDPTLPPIKITTDYCLFCKTPYRLECVELSNGVCQECASPLYRLPKEVDSLDMKRSLHRMKSSGTLQYYTYWPQIPRTAAIVDLSSRGVGLLVEKSLMEDALVKLDGKTFSAIARVAHQRSVVGQNKFSVRVGMEFLSCQFEQKKGLFFSAMA